MRKTFQITFTGRQLVYFLLILIFGVGSLMTVGNNVFALHADPEETSIDCNQSWRQNDNGNGLKHVTSSIYGVLNVNEDGTTVWNRGDVSAGGGGEAARTRYDLCPGTVLPAGTSFPPSGPAPRDLSDNTLLVVTYVVNPDGTITITSVTDTGEHGRGDETGGFTDITEPAELPDITEATAKKGFRCKPAGEGYQLNDVSLNADQSGFFVEVDAATLESWALLNGQSLNDVQSDYCGSLDPNAPAADTVTNTNIASGTTSDTTASLITIPLGNGATVTSDGAGAVTITDASGAVVASGTNGSVVVNDTTIVVPVNGTVTQPEDAGGAGSGGSVDANGHDGEILSCEENNGGQTVCKWVKP